jgi:hypothetical protein
MHQNASPRLDIPGYGQRELHRLTGNIAVAIRRPENANMWAAAWLMHTCFIHSGHNQPLIALVWAKLHSPSQEIDSWPREIISCSNPKAGAIG